MYVGSVESSVPFVSVSVAFMQMLAKIRMFDPVLEYVRLDEPLFVTFYMCLDMLLSYAEQNSSLQK